jgi:glycosyltransferase involved in cell wall biosynthesis
MHNEKSSSDISNICVVTQPARRETSKNHAYTLLNILSSITNVSILTANLSDDSPIRKEFETIEFTQKGAGDSILVSSFRFFLNQLGMCTAIFNRNEDTILFFGATSYILPIIFARLIGKTVVIEPRGDVPLSLRLKWENQLPDTAARILAGAVGLVEYISYHVATAIITYTPSMAEELELGKFENKLYTDGARYVDTDKFDSKVDYNERKDLVGFVGRLDVEKGIDKIVKIIKHLPEDIGFVFVGDGDYKEVIETELAEEIKMGQVEMRGWVDHDEVPEQLSQIKIHILMSDPTEGLPTIILESFACGTPVYAPPVSGIPDLIRANETGFLIDDMDPETVANRVVEILRRDDLNKMSSNCRELIEDEYSFDSAVRRYNDIFQEIDGSQ